MEKMAVKTILTPEVSQNPELVDKACHFMAEALRQEMDTSAREKGVSIVMVMADADKKSVSCKV